MNDQISQKEIMIKQKMQHLPMLTQIGVPVLLTLQLAVDLGFLNLPGSSLTDLWLVVIV